MRRRSATTARVPRAGCRRVKGRVKPLSTAAGCCRREQEAPPTEEGLLPVSPSQVPPRARPAPQGTTLTPPNARIPWTSVSTPLATPDPTFRACGAESARTVTLIHSRDVVCIIGKCLGHPKLHPASVGCYTSKISHLAQNPKIPLCQHTLVLGLGWLSQHG